MAKTFQQLKQAVRQWLVVDEEDTDERLPDAICGDLVNWAIKEYCRNRESRFGETGDTFNTVAQTRDYSEPARFSKPRKLWYIHPDTGRVVTLSLLLKDEFDAKFPASVVFSTGGPYSIAGTDTSLILGFPEAYMLWRRKICLAKVPDRVITIFRDYYELPVDLSGSSDTNQMTEQAEQYIIFKALADAELFGIEDDRIPQWAKRAEQLQMNLDSEDTRRLSVGRTRGSREPG